MTTRAAGQILVPKMSKRGESFGSKRSAKAEAPEWTRSRNSRRRSLTILTTSSTSQTRATTRLATIPRVQTTRRSSRPTSLPLSMAARLRSLSTSASSAPSALGAAPTCPKSRVGASSAEVEAARSEIMAFVRSARSARDQAARSRPHALHAKASACRGWT